MTPAHPSQIRNIAVLGTGIIGAGWVAFFLSRGLKVRASDPALGSYDRLCRFIDRAWPLLEDLGLPEGADRGGLSFVSSPEAALEGAEFVQESAPERLDIKRMLFALADRLTGPDVVLASSASALLMTPIQQGLVHPGRCVLAHPFNPPHLLPLVEISGGADTQAAAIDWTVAFFTHHHKAPVRLNREISGHIAGRLGAAVWQEAVSLVAEGVADVAAIDRAMALGPGLRFALAGPHMIFHMGGGEGGLAHFIAHLGPAQQRRWAELGRPQLTSDICQTLIEGVAAEAGGRTVDELEAERDRRLVALVKALRTPM